MKFIRYLLLSIAVVLSVVSCSSSFDSFFNLYPQDITLPAPTNLRQDLWWGFYCSDGDQVAATKGHVNFYMACFYQGYQQTFDDINTMKLPTVLATSYFTLGGNGYQTLLPDARTNLIGMLNDLESSGASQYVKYLFLCDECNTNIGYDPENGVDNSQVMSDLLDLVDSVVKGYPDLANVKYLITYSMSYPMFPAPIDSRIAVKGSDDYGTKSQFLVNGEYAGLKASLTSGQQTLLIPGCGGFQPYNVNEITSPVPWARFAEENSEVKMVMAFIEFDMTDSNGHIISPGCETNGSLAAYNAEGDSILGLTSNMP